MLTVCFRFTGTLIVPAPPFAMGWLAPVKSPHVLPDRTILTGNTNTDVSLEPVEAVLIKCPLFVPSTLRVQVSVLTTLTFPILTWLSPAFDKVQVYGSGAVIEIELCTKLAVTVVVPVGVAIAHPTNKAATRSNTTKMFFVCMYDKSTCRFL